MASYGFGGASSSSSLSPLAPPFMLDKPFSKLHSNPPINYSDPSHGTGLEHQVSIWNPLVQDSSVTNYMEPRLGAIGYQPSADIYKKPDPQQDNSSDGTHLLSLNSMSRPVYDDFQYEPYPNGLSVPTADTDTYHPPYSLPTPASDQDMMPHKEHNYDLLTSFGPASQGGYTSLDDTGSVLGVHYTPQWNGLWSGLSNAEQGKWLDIGGTFGSTGHKPSSDSSIPKCYVSQEHGKWLDLAGNFGSKDNKRSFDASTSKSYLNQGQHAFGSSGPVAETTASNKHSQDSSVAARVPMADVMHGKPDLQNPIQEYFFRKESGCGELAGNYASYASNAAPVIKSSPSAVNEVALTDFTSTKCAFTSSKGSGKGNGVVVKPQKFPEYHFEYKDPYFTLGLGCPVADKAFTAHSLLPGASSTQLENGLSKRSDHEGGLTEFFKPQASEAPQWRNPNFLNSIDDYPKILYSVEMPADIPDGQNTSEDSPCWKGASSAHFSPFSDMKMASAEVEKGPLGTASSVPSGSINQTTKAFQSIGVSSERDGSRSTSPRLFSFGLSGKDGSKFSSKNNLKTAYGSKSSLVPELNSEVKGDASWKKFTSFSTIDASKDAKCGCVSLSGSSSVSTSVDHNLTSSPPVNEATSQPHQLPRQELDVKPNLGTLLNVVKNMSDLLLSHCSINPVGAQELDSEILKQTISNLKSCLVKEIDPVKREVCLPHKKQHSSHCEVKKAEMDDKIDGVQINNVRAVAMDCHDHDALKISRSDIFQMKCKDDEIVQAIKKVLVEKFSCEEEEMLEKSQLYKNLWLEAEAALCAVTTRARLDRMKLEMVKSNSQGTNECPVNSSIPTDANKSGIQSQLEKMEPLKTNDVENVESSSGTAEFDCLRKNMLSFNAGRSSVIEVNHHEPPTAADTTCPPRNMDSSVISRFNILKSLCDVNSTKLGGATPSVEKQNHGPFDETQIRDILASSSGDAGAESSVMSRLQILKSRADHWDSSKTDDDNDFTPSPTYSDMVDPPTIDQSIQDSYFSSSSSYGIENSGAGATATTTADDPESSVMARFNLLKRRNEAAAAAVDLMGEPPQQVVNGSSSSSSSRGLAVDADVNTALKDQASGGGASRIINGHLVEGWYDCSGSGSDWEHVVKEDFTRQIDTVLAALD